VRTRLACANWKMHKTLDEVRAYAAAFRDAYVPESGVEVALFVPAPFLLPLSEAIGDAPVLVGAQCVHSEPSGAFTGAVSCEMVHSVGARCVLVGHSERRRIFGETDGELNMQLRAAIATGLRPIFCCGESLEEREAERTFARLTEQLVLGLDGLTARELPDLVVAYEPIWAIGTGRTATPAQAQVVHRFIRQTLRERFGESFASAVPILYGGSVKPHNTGSLVSEPDIDGVLVGGASLDPSSFAEIARNVGARSA